MGETPMAWRSILAVIASLAFAGTAFAQDSKAWLESQGLESTESKEFQDFEVVIAHVKGATDPKAMEERVVLFNKGKVAWQSGPKDSDPGSRWKIFSLGRDLDGDGQPDMHVSAFTGGANCCTTHFVYRIKPKVARVAAY